MYVCIINNSDIYNRLYIHFFNDLSAYWSIDRHCNMSFSWSQFAAGVTTAARSTAAAAYTQSLAENYKPRATKISELYASSIQKRYDLARIPLVVYGQIRNISLSFFRIGDGTCASHLQIVVPKNLQPQSSQSSSKYSVGQKVKVAGQFIIMDDTQQSMFKVDEISSKHIDKKKDSKDLKDPKGPKGPKDAKDSKDKEDSKGPSKKKQDKGNKTIGGAKVAEVGKDDHKDHKVMRIFYPFELVASSIEILGSPAEIKSLISIPSQIKIKPELWREQVYLRHHDESHQARMRIASRLKLFWSEFYTRKGLLHNNPPVMVQSDCEGGGEMFRITTDAEIDALKKHNLTGLKDVKDQKVQKDQKNKKDNLSGLNGTNNSAFFKRPFYLTVSSQLELEAMVHGQPAGGAWTENPSFRAEQSQTSRHLACFQHNEAEIPNIDLTGLMDFCEELVKSSFATVLRDCLQDVLFLESSHSNVPQIGLVDKLTSMSSNDFGRITYTEAIKILHQNKAKFFSLFPEVPVLPEWGQDLRTECERFLTEHIFCKPVMVYNMPRGLKAFYMKQNENCQLGRETVQGFDLLIPGIGEVIGASVREDDQYKLQSVMIQRGMLKLDRPLMLQLYKDVLQGFGLTTPTSSDSDSDVLQFESKGQYIHDESLVLAVQAYLTEYTTGTAGTTSNSTGASGGDTKSDLKQEPLASTPLNKLPFGDIDWYVDLRRSSSCRTGGFGMGFERLVATCTSTVQGGINVRDCVGFPIYYGK